MQCFYFRHLCSGKCKQPLKRVGLWFEWQISKQRRSKSSVWWGEEVKPKRQQRRTRVTEKLFCKSSSIASRQTRSQQETFQGITGGGWGLWDENVIKCTWGQFGSIYQNFKCIDLLTQQLYVHLRICPTEIVMCTKIRTQRCFVALFVIVDEIKGGGIHWCSLMNLFFQLLCWLDSFQKKN